MVGPVAIGINRFILEAGAPNPNSIPNNELLGVTVVLINCAYKNQKFVQIGYYVNNDYAEPVNLECPPNPVEPSKLFRNIMAEEPRLTNFNIDWSGQGLNVTNAPVNSSSSGIGQSEEVEDDEDALNSEQYEDNDDMGDDANNDDDDDG